MSLSNDDIGKIARLAQLQIDAEDAPRYAQELSGVLDLVNELNKIDTDDVLPMAHPTDAIQRLRADEVTEQNQRDKLLENAPQSEDGLFLVPKVID